VFSLGNKDLKVNDEIDEVLLSEEHDFVDTIVKDPVENIIEHNKDRAKKREEREKKEKEILKRMEKDVKRDKRTAWWKNFLSLFLPPTWIKWIQYWEDLLLVIFIDATLLSILFSLLAIMYIIITFDDGDNWMVFVCKLVGAVCLGVLSLVVQINTNSQNKGK
jgi:hypothetical protein